MSATTAIAIDNQGSGASLEANGGTSAPIETGTQPLAPALFACSSSESLAALCTPERSHNSRAIPLSEPAIGGAESHYVLECLDSGWVSSVGAYVDRFEREFASAVGRRYAVAMASGTASLHIALEVAGVRAGDEVLMPAVTFVAPANTIRYVGAHPVFFDAEPEFWQMDSNAVVRYLRHRCVQRDGAVWCRTSGRRVSAILPVHVLGHPVDMDPLIEIAAEFGIPIIEDATESLGARQSGRAAGTAGLAACFSFNGNKMITTGGGGMLVTDDERVAQRARYLSTQAKDDPNEYVHASIGYNYRLTNLQAALGCAQLARLAEFVAARRRIAHRYQHELAGTGCKFLAEAPGVRSAYWLSSMRVEGESSRPLLKYLHSIGIQARPIWQPMHLSPAHSQDRPVWPMPVADAIYSEGLSLPSSPSLSAEDQEFVIGSIRRFLRTGSGR